MSIDDWSWTTQQDGSLLFTFKKENILVEPTESVTWEEMMATFEGPTIEVREVQAGAWTPIGEGVEVQV